MTGPFNGTGEETTAVFCLRKNIRSPEPPLGTCARLSGSSSRLVTLLGPAEVSIHAPRARNSASSQRGVKFAGNCLSFGGGGGSGTYLCLSSSLRSSAGVVIL